MPTMRTKDGTEGHSTGGGEVGRYIGRHGSSGAQVRRPIGDSRPTARLTRPGASEGGRLIAAKQVSSGIRVAPNALRLAGGLVHRVAYQGVAEARSAQSVYGEV